MSGAWDFDMRRARDCCGRGRAATGRPGTNSGASGASEPATEPATEDGAEFAEVSWPPNTLEPLTSGCAPPPPIGKLVLYFLQQLHFWWIYLRRPFPAKPPPRPPRLPPLGRPWAPVSASLVGAGLSGNKASEFCVAPKSPIMAVPEAPPLPVLLGARLCLGGLFPPAGLAACGSAVVIVLLG